MSLRRRFTTNINGNIRKLNKYLKNKSPNTTHPTENKVRKQV